ncbi:MAG: hypothetical protein ABR924_13950, partial [Terracidiphilus sp.]
GLQKKSLAKSKSPAVFEQLTMAFLNASLNRQSVGLARTEHLPSRRLMGGLVSMGRMGGLGGFGRR